MELLEKNDELITVLQVLSSISPYDFLHWCSTIGCPLADQFVKAASYTPLSLCCSLSDGSTPVCCWTKSDFSACWKVYEPSQPDGKQGFTEHLPEWNTSVGKIKRASLSSHFMESSMEIEANRKFVWFASLTCKSDVCCNILTENYSDGIFCWWWFGLHRWFSLREDKMLEINVMTDSQSVKIMFGWHIII